MVPIQLGVTTLPTEQVLEEMTSEIGKANDALGLSSPPSGPFPFPADESPNKPIEATQQPQQPRTGEGAAAAVQQSDIPVAGCWPEKESDVKGLGGYDEFPKLRIRIRI